MQNLSNLSVLKKTLLSADTISFTPSKETQRSGSLWNKFAAAAISIPLAFSFASPSYSSESPIPKSIISVNAWDVESYTGLSFSDIKEFSTADRLAFITPSGNGAVNNIEDSENTQIALDGVSKYGQEFLDTLLNIPRNNTVSDFLISANSIKSGNDTWIEAFAYASPDESGMQNCMITMPNVDDLDDLSAHFFRTNPSINPAANTGLDPEDPDFVKKLSSFIVMHEAAHCSQSMPVTEDERENMINVLDREIKADLGSLEYLHSEGLIDDAFVEHVKNGRLLQGISALHWNLQEEHVYPSIDHSTGYALTGFNKNIEGSLSPSQVMSGTQYILDKLYENYVWDIMDPEFNTQSLGTMMVLGAAIAADDTAPPEARLIVKNWMDLIGKYEISWPMGIEMNAKTTSDGSTVIWFTKDGKKHSPAEGVPALMSIDSEGNTPIKIGFDSGKQTNLAQNTNVLLNISDVIFKYENPEYGIPMGATQGQ